MYIYIIEEGVAYSGGTIVAIKRKFADALNYAEELVRILNIEIDLNNNFNRNDKQLNGLLDFWNPLIQINDGVYDITYSYDDIPTKNWYWSNGYNTVSINRMNTNIEEDLEFKLWKVRYRYRHRKKR